MLCPNYTYQYTNPWRKGEFVHLNIQTDTKRSEPRKRKLIVNCDFKNN